MSRGRSASTTKVFVGSLPSGVTTDDLRKLFEPYGSIAECDIANRCGFLHLDDHDLAMKAIAELNGVDFMGGKISVEKGRVKPRRPGGGGPMRGGRGGDRGGPYSRGGGDFRGPPRNAGYGGREPPFRGGGDRFGGGYDRMPQRGGYGGGMDDRRPPGGYDDRRPAYPDRYGGGGGYGGERRYDDRPLPGDMDGPMGGYDDRRGGGGYDDRRPMMGGERRPPIMEPPARGPSAPDLFSRRDGMGPKAGGYGDRPYGGGSTGTNGFGGAAGGGSGGYGERSGYGGGGGYGGGAGNGGGYGDSYGGGGGGGGAPAAGRGRYDTAYPPLPAQRSFASGAGGGPGTRRDMPLGRRF